ncbi:MAG: glucosamine-6-phosphate deaminase [Propionicimonas sp.]
MQKAHYQDLDVTILDNNAELGVAAAAEFAAAVQAELAEASEIAVILATGNSQFSFTEALPDRSDIDWSRITVLHMDEYLGMDASHPASFRRWMQERIVKPLGPARFEGIRGDAPSVEEELQRYTALLRELKPVICVMGIGENGHLAFNDPPADFNPPELIRVVEMDEVSRRQQVGEGHFPSLAETPTHAISLTIPALLAPRHVLVLTPEPRKAEAVRRALEGEIGPLSPASILRTQPQAKLFLDQGSAGLLDQVAASEKVSAQ